MTRVVLDTNVLVSAFWKKPSNAASIVDMIASRQLAPCYSAEILVEYKDVLHRQKFRFADEDVANVLSMIEKEGVEVVPYRSNAFFHDESDRKFKVPVLQKLLSITNGRAVKVKSC